MRYDTLVIGAGFSGLAAGIRAAMFGRRVLVLERHYLWGGLNSFYKRGGRLFDTGLHALTNCGQRGPKGTPLGRLLRQLRIPFDTLELLPQRVSEIVLGERRVRFSNDPVQWTSAIAELFPNDADRFTTLHAELAAADLDRVGAPDRSARKLLTERLGDGPLVDFLLMPTAYYSSAREGDLDWDQFVMLYQAIFCEGMAQPRGGIRPLLKLFVDRLIEVGGELRRKAPVVRILVERDRACGVELEDGQIIAADHVLSSAGWPATMALAGPAWSVQHVDTRDRTRITVLETISVLDTPCERIAGPRPLDCSTVFFADTERFAFKTPEDLVDPHHGVISIPQNFGTPSDWVGHEPILRVTLFAHPDKWHQLPSAEYTQNKRAASDAALALTARLYSDPRPHEVFRDVFTPRTITKYTGHTGGAIYGGPRKWRDGTTPIENLVLIGADQGMSGIVGAGLSGIAMANRHVLGASREIPS